MSDHATPQDGDKFTVALVGANGEELGRHEGEWTVEGKDIIIDVKSDGVAVLAVQTGRVSLARLTGLETTSGETVNITYSQRIP